MCVPIALPSGLGSGTAICPCPIGKAEVLKRANKVSSKLLKYLLIALGLPR
jgi:hypothetical protein